MTTSCLEYISKQSWVLFSLVIQSQSGIVGKNLCSFFEAFLFKYNRLIQQDNDNVDKMAVSEIHLIDISNDNKLSGIVLSRVGCFFQWLFNLRVVLNV